jgi:hypothetical protein
MIISSRSEKLILILLLPITFIISVCFWLAGLVASIFVWLFNWTYKGYGEL